LTTLLGSSVLCQSVNATTTPKTNETFSVEQMQKDDHAIDKLFVASAMSIPQDMQKLTNSIDTVIQNLHVTFHQNKFLLGAHSFVELPAKQEFLQEQQN